LLWFVTGGQKLSDDDKPLVIVLMWGALNSSHCLCLVENKESTIDVCIAVCDVYLQCYSDSHLFCQWHSFAAAELENFLLMLKKEEDRHLNKVYIMHDVLAASKCQHLVLT
jgi:hypothetical protein